MKKIIKVIIETKSGEFIAEGFIHDAYFVSRTFPDIPLPNIRHLGLIIKEIEEKKPVKRWLWMVLRQHEKYSPIGNWELLQNGVFYSEEDMQHFKWGSVPAPLCKKILWSETEFEE